jgi:hypothetical protein
MSAIFHRIDFYKIWYFGKNDHRIQIQVYQGNDYVGSLSFTDAGEIPDNEVLEGKFVRLTFHKEDYLNIIDLLRNEKPLFIWINEDNLIGGIATDELEPVGELEEM